MSDFFSTLLIDIQKSHWTEILAVIFGLFYIVLAIRENVWCWFWGILSCGLWAYATYTFNEYYVDAILNIFYVVMGFVGIYQWSFVNKEKDRLHVTQMSVSQHVMAIVLGVAFTFLFGYLFQEYTPAKATYLDSFTTAFAIFATFMTIQKKLESWIYWIVVDVLYVYMYWVAGAPLFMLLFIVNCVLAIKGFLDWRKLVIIKGEKIVL